MDGDLGRMFITMRSWPKICRRLDGRTRRALFLVDGAQGIGIILHLDMSREAPDWRSRLNDAVPISCSGIDSGAAD